ncbi:MAG TPA: hypothetical protein VE591_04645 [Candidatus Acidoferrum sp.]|nr:hypothetical protein [Candidatus Acidoferrum sp.]
MQNRSDTPADQRRAAPDRPEDTNAAQARTATTTAPPQDARAAPAQAASAQAATQAASRQTTSPSTTGGDDAQLLPGDALQEFRVSWERIQTGFVDQPRESVQRAHDLVGQVVDRLSQSFARQRDGLEGTWSSGADVSTEDLRIALQRYRSFFDRLLST